MSYTLQLGGTSRADLLWEWNGLDVSQFGDGDGTPSFTTNGPENGTLAVATLDSTTTNQDTPREDVLLYSFSGGGAGGGPGAFFLINDITDTLPEHYIIEARMGPRDNGGGQQGENCEPGLVTCAQDSTHHFRVRRDNVGTELRIRGGNGDVGDGTTSCNAGGATSQFNQDAGTILRVECVMGQPSSGVDPSMFWRIVTSSSWEKYAKDSGWAGAGTFPSTSWDAGWQTGGNIRRPGIMFTELGVSGRGYFGSLKIYSV